MPDITAPETQTAETETAVAAQAPAAPEETEAVLLARDAGAVTADAAADETPAEATAPVPDEARHAEPDTAEVPETVLARDEAQDALPSVEASETLAEAAPAEPAAHAAEAHDTEAHAAESHGDVAHAAVAAPEPPAEAAAPSLPEPVAALLRAEGVRTDEAASALRGVVEINLRLLTFMRDETEAAFSFWRALRGASGPGEAMQLQAEEVGRIVSAAVACWSDVSRRASGIALASLPKAA
ncbi:phasin family protein [Methylobacterium oryzisoli]|uniref:phasin family protein n=1 Tax=Methylobacterium oryzisoli TaxID=3385502 RepID=UPI0038914299